MNNKATVSSIMTLSPVVANQFHNLSQVLRLFTEFPIHHLPVVDGNNKIIGIISSNDIPKMLVQLATRTEKIQLDSDSLDKAVNLVDLMTANPTTISPETTIVEAARILNQKKFLSLPVVEAGVLVGIITVKDVMEFLLG